MASYKAHKINNIEHLCDYDCGSLAGYRFINGKYCCSEYLAKCPGIRKINSNKNSGSNNAMHGNKHSEKSLKRNAESNKRNWNNPNSIYHTTEWRNKVRKIGSENGNWKGGISFLPYSPLFTSQLKLEIKNRDNNKCRNPECLGKYSFLTVHHIDYDKQNCLPSNLITICNTCNSRANGNRSYWTEFYKKVLMEDNNGIIYH